MHAECIKPNFKFTLYPAQVFSKERKAKANNKPQKSRKHVDPFDVCDSPVQQPKRPNPPPNGYIVTLLEFICSNVFTYYSRGGKFYHQVYPDAIGDLIVEKKMHVFSSIRQLMKGHNQINLVMFISIWSFHVSLYHIITALHLNLTKQNKTLKYDVPLVVNYIFSGICEIC